MKDGCPFCDYSGPSEVIADWSDVIVFEPLHPVTRGHLLVVPKRHVARFHDDPLVSARVAEVAAREVDWREGSYNVIVSTGAPATQTVEHLHFHLVPRREGDGLLLPWSER